MSASDIEALVERMEREIRPLLVTSKRDGGYDCCGCSTYDQILNHAIAIVREGNVSDPTLAHDDHDEFLTARDYGG